MNREINLLVGGSFKTPMIGMFEPHSPEWHEARKGKIGGSSVGAIMGLSPFRSALTEYYIQTGEYVPDETPSMSMQLGTLLEEPILQMFANEHPELEVYRTGTYGNEWATINPDGLYKTADGSWGLIEVKFSRDYMKEIPPSYKAQMTLYAGLLGIKTGKLVALAGSTYVEHDFEFDEFEWEVMLKQIGKFLNAVKTRTRPDFDGSNSTYETMRAVNSEIDPDLQVDLGDLGVELFNAHTAYKKAEAHFKEMQSRTLDALGPAKYGYVDDVLVCSKTQRGNYAPTLQMKGKK